MNIILTVLVVALIALTSAQQLRKIQSTDPDVNRNVTQLITSKGYPCVDYSVTTDDGYILSVQNIPHGKGGSGRNKYPVLLQHGLFDSSATWVMNNATQSLGFILADAGFDVWLGNSRGNAYCQSNTGFSNSSKEFWEFSWDELAAYDLPAKINYVLQTTGASSLSYIGHSEGTEIGFARFGQDPDLASKVDLFVALAPVAYLNHVGEILIEAAKTPDFIIKLIFGDKGLFQPWTKAAEAQKEVCTDDPRVCQDTICLLAGCESNTSINSTRLPVIFSHFPSGSSVQNLFHYQQSVKSGEFQMYDFGRTGNNKHYGQPTPPLYDLSLVSTNTALFYGSNDKMADPVDVQTMLKTLPTPVHVEEIQNYGHGDFVWGTDAQEKLYPTVVSLIQKYMQL